MNKVPGLLRDVKVGRSPLGYYWITGILYPGGARFAATYLASQGWPNQPVAFTDQGRVKLAELPDLFALHK